MTETIISWLEQIWGIECYETAVRVGNETIHPANYQYFLDAASAITVVAFIAIIALFFLVAAFLGRHRR